MPLALPSSTATVTALTSLKAVTTLTAVSVALLGITGCAGERGPGVIHHVESGENLYRIGLRYGVNPKQIARENGIRDVRDLRPGQRLFIPKPRRRTTETARKGSGRAGGASGGDMAQARKQARANARRQSSLQWAWPVRGRLSSRFGMRRGRPHEGIDLAAARGTPIFASESGRVIHSGRLGAYGKVVIVKHAGAYRSVYAHARRLFVRKGEFVEQGQKIAEVGTTGRSTGPHLHFEIRKKETPQNPLGYLP